MKKQAFETHTLHEPNRALRVYLDALLSEASFSVEQEDALLSPQEPIASEQLTATEQVQSIGQAQDIPVDKASEEIAAEKSVDEEAGILCPDWAQNRFQCLSFQVAGVTLAAPLEMLDGIVELHEPITELPGYAPWVMGLLPNRGRNVQVVDIAEIIMPDERRAVIPPANERAKYLVLIDDGKFGLAADSISQVLSLDPSDVRWGRKNSRRPWLAGTVVDQMCALLEMGRLCKQLQSGLKGAV